MINDICPQCGGLFEKKFGYPISESVRICMGCTDRNRLADKRAKQRKEEYLKNQREIRQRSRDKKRSKK